MRLSDLNKNKLSLSSLKKRAVAFFCLVLILFPTFLTSCTLRARNQDKFNRLVALSNLSIENSTLTISSNSLKVGETATVTLTIKDKNSNPSPISELNVSFSLSDGTSTGTFSPTFDNGDGKYTSIFTATTKGSDTTLSATIKDFGLVSQTQTVTVENSAPSITVSSNRTFPVDSSNPPLIQGTSYTFDFGISDINQDTFTSNCSYQTLGLSISDPNFAASGTDCAQLNSLTTSASTGLSSIGKASYSSQQLKWTPTYSQRGTYQFTINATDGKNSSSKSLIVSVRENSTTTNLLSAVDALFATSASGLSSSTASAPASSTDSASTWLNLIGSALHGSCTFGSSTPWAGTGQASLTSLDPYRVNFTSSNSDSMSLGSVLSSSNQFAVQTWIKPSSPSTPSAVIASNGGGSGDGFVLRQSATATGKAEFLVGKRYYSYRDLILSDKPVGYWRLGETSGTTATDLSAYGNNGTYTGAYTLGQNGIIAEDSNKSTLFGFDGTNKAYVQISGSGSLQTVTNSSYSMEAWINVTSFPSVDCATNSSICQGGIFLRPGAHTGLRILNTGEVQANIWTSSTYTISKNISSGSWHHLVLTVDDSSKTIYFYVDGDLVPTSPLSYTGTLRNYGTNNYYIGIGNPAHSLNNGQFSIPYNGKVDDVSLYNYTLTPSQVTEHYQTGMNGNYKPYPGNAVLADKPVGYWRLGEKSGGIAYDYSGNGNNGVLNSGVTQNQVGALSNSGDSDTAVAFDGTSGKIEVPYNAALNTEKFSAEVWAKVSGGAGTVRSPLTQRDTVGAGPYAQGFILYATAANTWASWIGDGATAGGSGWKAVTGPAVVLNTWTHLVVTYDGTKESFYVNGTLAGTNTTVYAPNTARPLRIGAGATELAGNYYFNGSVDEVAVYNYVLSPTQIAAHYNSGVGSGWWTCQSLTPLSSSNWNLLSAIYDGTTAKLFVNGQQECSVTPGTTYSGSITNTTVGSNSNRIDSFWQGALSVFKVFGANDLSLPATASTVKNDFDVESGRFRSIPLDSIISTGLVSHFDAANANQGLTPYTNGCANSDLSWFDLSYNLFNGSLLNFQTCGSSEGWVGDGSVSNPYALVFNATHSNFITLSNSSGFVSADTTFTLSGWFKTTSTANPNMLIGQGNPAGGPTRFLVALNSGRINSLIKDTSAGLPANRSSATTTLNNGSWHHFAVVISTSTTIASNNSITIYVDGAVNQGTLTQSGTTYGGNANNPIIIGAKGYPGNYLNYFTGSISNIQIYNRGLKDQEVKYNCLAQESRFTNTPQSICGAP